MSRLLRAVIAAVLAASAGIMQLTAQELTAKCKLVHAEMVEHRTTTECKPSHPFCFVGVVDGNHGLRGTTYFKGDSGTLPIPTSPEFIGYSGVFEYTTDHGALVMRETGVTSSKQGVVTAYQKVTSATGEYEGASGYFFVSGHNDGQQITTRVFGELCYP
jgi:hypothetical protein